MNSEAVFLYLKSKFPNTSSFFSGLLLLLTDILGLIFCLLIGFGIVNLFFTSDINLRSFIYYSIYIPLFVIIFAVSGLYPGIMNPPADEVRKFSTNVFFVCAIIILSLYVSKKESYGLVEFLIKDSKAKAVACAIAIVWPVATIVLPAMRTVFKSLFAKFHFWGVPAIIYCNDDSAYFLVDKLLSNRDLGYHPAIIINSSCKDFYEYKNIPVFSSDQEIFSVIKRFNIKTALLFDFKENQSQIMSTFRYTINVPKSQTNFTCTQQLKDIDGILAFSSIHNLTFKTNYVLKRTLDITAVLLLSPIWLPIFILTAILTKLTSKGPIFYGHKRVGKNSKEFKCWKFRSMRINSQEMLEEILRTDPVRREEWEKDRKFNDDPRVTGFGKFLRKTSLDELPQVFNILFGQMSLVGPRPVTEPELVKYGEYKDYVLSVLPGISGMWQISGRSDTGYEERIGFDTYYIQNWSIWLDIWILIKTVWVVISQQGAK